MKVTEEAEEDINRQKDYDRKKLAEEIKGRLEQNRDNDNISYIHKPQFGIEFHRLKLIEDSFNHRIYFDFVDSELTVFAVRHREFTYSQEDLKEVEKRLRNMNRD